MRIAGLLIMAGCCWLGWAGTARAAAGDHASAELIADVSAVQPGAVFHVAVRITMSPGWHIYWMNPGDAGLPTTVKFTGPEGFKIELLGDPTPTRFDLPGNVIDYGYTEPTLFIAKVTAPADLKPGSAVDFSASVKWLVCNQMCIPGKASPKISLPIDPSPKPANEAAFKNGLDALPVPAAEKATVEASTGGPGRSIVLHWHEPVKHVQAFCAPPLEWDVQAVNVTGDEHQTTLGFNYRSLDPAAKSVEMPIVLAYDDAAGHRRSVRLDDHFSND